MPDLHMMSGAYALDALDDVERAGYERHLRSCGSCAAEVIEFQESTVYLAERVALAPPVYLRSRVLAEASRIRQTSAGSRVRPARGGSLRRLVAVAAAGLVIAGAAGLGGIAWQGHQAANDAQIAADAASDRAAELTRVMTDPGRLEAVRTPTVGGTATVVAAQGKAVLATDQMPVAAPGKAYQVWVIDKKASIRSAGLLSLKNGSGQSLVPGVSKGDTVAISVEPEGLSQQPTTTPIVLIKVA
jgi:hypothetical protein